MALHEPDSSEVRWAELDEVTRALEALADTLSDEADFQVALDQACRQVIQAVPGVDMASVTIVRDGKAETLAATDSRIISLDVDQYRAGQGPSLHAVTTGELVRIQVDQAQRWPAFAEAARRAGIGSFLSAPLPIDSEFTGSVNCYGLQHHGFRELDAQLLALYTTAVKAALRSVRRYQQARDLTEQLRSALTSRAVIDQAKGVLMAVHHIDADTAFATLVGQSQRENVKLRDLATRLVTAVVQSRRSDR
jgi:transcriptional regulator with GAF, ATPase, and Fis domain